jgi:hypothetical protein
VNHLGYIYLNHSDRLGVNYMYIYIYTSPHQWSRSMIRQGTRCRRRRLKGADREGEGALRGGGGGGGKGVGLSEAGGNLRKQNRRHMLRIFRVSVPRFVCVRCCMMFC